MQINALTLSHQFLREHIRPGDFCVDATAGRGRDTAYLRRLVGPTGRVLAFDIQQDALDSTAALLEAQGLTPGVELILDGHENLARYAAPESVDAVVFNLGWLPGGDHSIHTKAETSLRAIDQGLELLREGGVMSLCLYYGRNNGYEERDAVLAHLETLDPARYTVLAGRFLNRRGDVPIPVFVVKQG
jgi:SAM-dependent methyltransferase